MTRPPPTRPSVGDDWRLPGDSLRPGQRLGGYVVDGLAGRGGMGVVYRARDPRIGRPVALKVLAPALADDAAFRRRFEREWRLAAALDHPNVATVYGAGEQDGRLYLAMQFIDGVGLDALLEERGRLPAREAAMIIDQVAGALDAAHAAG